MSNARKSGQCFPRVGVSRVSGAPLHRSGEWLHAELCRGAHLKGVRAEFSRRALHRGEEESMRGKTRSPADALHKLHLKIRLGTVLSFHGLEVTNRGPDIQALTLFSTLGRRIYNLKHGCVLDIPGQNRSHNP